VVLFAYEYVDFSSMVDEEFLERLGIEKGTRKVVNHEKRGRVLRAMDGCSYKLHLEAPCPTHLWRWRGLAIAELIATLTLESRWPAVWAATHLVVSTGSSLISQLYFRCI
jgi:hypothetical protein